MTRTVLKITVVTLILATLFVISNRNTQAELGATTVEPQDKPVEQTRKNIKVLTGMPDSHLIPVMNYMAASIGRRCNFCHVNNQGQWDYASDAKPEKNSAREMIKMVLDLRKHTFHGADEITCFTCHRGQDHPVNVPALPLPVPSPRPQAPAATRGGISPGAAPSAGAPGAQTTPGAPAVPSATPALPSADEIFSKYIAAVGGQANIDKIKSRTAKGTVAQPNGGAISFELAQAAPDKFHILATTEQGAFERGFSGSIGWEKGPRGVRQLSAAELGQLQASVGLLRNLRLKEQFTGARVRTGGKIGDRATYLVIGTTRDNRQERLFFDVETGLLLRRISYLTTLLGVIPEQIDFEDYREVDGVKFPFGVRVSAIDVGNPVSTRTFSEMKLNASADEAKFNMPAVTP